MNNAVYQSRVNGLSAIAKKVFSVVPIAEAWPPRQISAELTRATGSAADQRIVSGCLNTLINLGLVTEPKPNTFKRVAMKEAAKAKSAAEHETKQPLEITQMSTIKALIQGGKQNQPATAIEKLSAISAQAHSLAEGMKRLASDIESAAIEIDEQAKADKSDTEKLKQLQALLKSLS